jgi:hypothetical protein
MAAAVAACCGSCRHLQRTGYALEADLPQLRTMSSAYAAVRADDGVCGVHQRYVASYYVCGAHEAAMKPSAGGK